MAHFVLKQVGPKVVRVEHDGWALEIGLPRESGGSGKEPSPTELLAISVAACKAITGLVWAERNGVTVTGMETEVTSEYAETPRRLGAIDVVMKNVRSQVPAEKMARFESAVERCHVAQTLIHPPAMSMKVE